MSSRLVSAALLAIVTLLLGACSSVRDGIRPYRIDVRQGNYVTPEMVAQLKKGMSPDQVRFVLGTPLIVDPFRTDRWDYVYRFAGGRGKSSRQHLSVRFSGDKLAEIISDIEAPDPDKVEPTKRVIEIADPAPAK